MTEVHRYKVWAWTAAVFGFGAIISIMLFWPSKIDKPIQSPRSTPIHRLPLAVEPTEIRRPPKESLFASNAPASRESVVDPMDLALSQDASLAEPDLPSIPSGWGCTVVVSGWLGSINNVITDVHIQVDNEAGLPSESWWRAPDGRLCTFQLLPGRHLIWLTHRSKEHGSLASMPEPFDLSEGEQKDIHIQLYPDETLVGRLDDRVPRPIVEGYVMVSVHQGEQGNGPTIDRAYQALVNAEGFFAVPNISRGDGQIVVLCRGWSSQRVRVTTSDGDSASHDERSVLTAQHVALPSSGMVTVAMEPTGALELAVSAQDGSPVADATISVSPYVPWQGVRAIAYPWREWSSSTDSGGFCRIEDLPPSDRIAVTIDRVGFTLSPAEPEGSMIVVSGQAVVGRYVLTPAE